MSADSKPAERVESSGLLVKALQRTPVEVSAWLERQHDTDGPPVALVVKAELSTGRDRQIRVNLPERVFRRLHGQFDAYASEYDTQ